MAYFVGGLYAIIHLGFVHFTTAAEVLSGRAAFLILFVLKTIMNSGQGFPQTQGFITITITITITIIIIILRVIIITIITVVTYVSHR